MAVAAATLAASATSSMQAAQVTPISADTRLPPMMDQGCASGLDGTANSSTADAPIGAMNHGLKPASRRWLSHAAKNTPSSAPRQPSSISRRDTVTGAGTKVANHSRPLRSSISALLAAVVLAAGQGTKARPRGPQRQRQEA